MKESGQGTDKIIGVILGVIIGGVMIFAGIWIMGDFTESTSGALEGTGTNHDYNAHIDNSGTQTVDLGTFDDLKSATTIVEYDLSDNILLTVQVNSTTVYQENASGTDTIENDVAYLITKGSNELDVSIDNENRVNSCTTDLNVTTYEESQAETSYENAQESVWDAIGMSPLMITIAVIVGILTILVGGLATGKINIS